MLHRTMSYQERCISTRSNTARRSMPRTPLLSRLILRSLVTLSATPSPPSSHGPSPIGEASPSYSTHLSARCFDIASITVCLESKSTIRRTWTGGDKEEIAAEFFEQDRWGRTVALEKRDLSHHRRRPDEELSVDNYMVRSVLSTSYPYKGVKVVTARREIETPSGAPVLIEDFEADNGGIKGVRLAYIHEGESGFMAIFYAPGEVFDEWRPVVDYCIDTFSIGNFSVADGMSDR